MKMNTTWSWNLGRLIRLLFMYIHELLQTGFFFRTAVVVQSMHPFCRRQKRSKSFAIDMTKFYNLLVVFFFHRANR